MRIKKMDREFKKKMYKSKIIILLCLSIIVLISVLSYTKIKKEESQTPHTKSKKEAPQVPQIDIKKLIGKWYRPDGGYLIDIQKIENGKLDAAYYNPKSINVSRALYMQKNGELKVFIELNDRGYPGSTYTLTYDGKKDMLAGDYFHAGMNQVFKVIFLRDKK